MVRNDNLRYPPVVDKFAHFPLWTVKVTCIKHRPDEPRMFTYYVPAETNAEAQARAHSWLPSQWTPKVWRINVFQPGD